MLHLSVCASVLLYVDCDFSASQLLGLVRPNSVAAGEVFPVTSGQVSQDFPMW